MPRESFLKLRVNLEEGYTFMVLEEFPQTPDRLDFARFVLPKRGNNTRIKPSSCAPFQKDCRNLACFKRFVLLAGNEHHIIISNLGFFKNCDCHVYTISQ